MQALARPSANGVGGPYSAAQIFNALTSATGRETWVFDRLGPDRRYLSDLTPYVDKLQQAPQIEHDTTRDVRRTLKLYVRGDAALAPLHDLVRPKYQLFMSDGGIAEFKLGVFTLLPSQDDIWPSSTWHQYTGTDLSQLLVDGAFDSSFSLPAGTNYRLGIAEIIATLGGPVAIPVRMPDPGATLPASLSWDSGTSRLAAVNTLLAAVNFFPAWFDEEGALRSSPIPNYDHVVPLATFDQTGSQAITRIPMKRQPDLSRVYNQVRLKCEDARHNTFYGFYSNDDPENPVSTGNWHKKLTELTDSTIPDVGTANAKATTLCQAASRIFSPQVFDTTCWPVSQDNDVYQFIYETNDEPLSGSLYLEIHWLMYCGPGQPTTHYFTKILPTSGGSQ